MDIRSAGENTWPCFKLVCCSWELVYSIFFWQNWTDIDGLYIVAGESICDGGKSLVCELVCCSWEGGGVSLPVVTLSNDVLCTAPSTHPLHHSTMHNAQNVLKCNFLYPPTVAALPRKQSVHNAANTSWSTLRRCTVCVHCTHQKSKSIVLPPCRPMLYSSTAILLLGAPPLESVAAMWNPPACSYLCWFALGRAGRGADTQISVQAQYAQYNTPTHMA